MVSRRSRPTSLHRGGLPCAVTMERGPLRCSSGARPESEPELDLAADRKRDPTRSPPTSAPHVSPPSASRPYAALREHVAPADHALTPPCSLLFLGHAWP
ncbi:hypothetical protein Taro_051948 [Colocasia esculenta]|uniref:Uncharacterized protein n=1 Tax=Colocasia esculenta TaxID=4460 RepID=A0A843XHC6_COLES|nr:hypothetical protein [Colocasia esculenta]